MFDFFNGFDYVNSSTTATADSNVAAQSPALAADDNPLTWFGSNAAAPADASLQLDVGNTGPYYDELTNVTVFNRWVLS